MNKKIKKTNFSKADFIRGMTDTDKESLVKSIILSAIAANKRTIEEIKVFIYNTLYSKFTVHMDTRNYVEFYQSYTWVPNRIQPELDAYYRSPAGIAEIAAKNAADRGTVVTDAQNKAALDLIAAKKQVELDAIAAAAKSTSTISTKTWLMIGGGILLVGVAIFFIKKYKK